MARKRTKKLSSYANSKEAWKVAAWRFQNQTSTDTAACATDTGLEESVVKEWWDGVDVLYRESGGTHFSFPLGTTPEKVGNTFKETLGNKQ